jgi:branched-chain amino acid transport system substrate-binding protein
LQTPQLVQESPSAAPLQTTESAQESPPPAVTAPTPESAQESPPPAATAPTPELAQESPPPAATAPTPELARESPPPAATAPTPELAQESPPATPTPTPSVEKPPPIPEALPQPGAAQAQASPVEDPEATPIGFFAPMSGPQASFGLDARNGATLAVEEINTTGGALGHPIKLIIKDTESLPEQTTLVVTGLINDDKVAALIGEVVTDRSLIAARLAQASGIPMVTPAATNETVTAEGDCIFRVCYTDPFQAEVILKLARSLDVEKAAILFDASNPYGNGLMETLKEGFLKHGGTIVAEGSYQAGDTNFNAQLTEIRQKNPDSIFLPSYYPEAALIIRQARQLGIDVPFLGTDGWDSADFLKVSGRSANNCYFTSHFSAESASDKGKTFSDGYFARFQSAPPALAALAYDAVWLVADALKRAGNKEHTALRDALAATKDFHGATGKISFDQGRDPKKPAIVIRVQDGKFTYLETIQP